MKQLILVSAIATMLTACGGGDSSAGSSSSGSSSGAATGTPPTVSGLTNASIASGTTDAEQFTVGDAQVSASALTVTATSSNTTLLPNSGLVLSGTTSARTLAITPANGQTGTANISVVVSDGTLTTTQTITITVTGTANANALQTSVTTPTYAAGSAQLNVYNEINNARQAYGVGLLAENSMLDQTASHHATYLSANASTLTASNLHDESSSNPDYTGDTANARIVASGYNPRETDEVIVRATYTNTATDTGTAAADEWLATVYHRMGVLGPDRDFGIGNVVTSQAGGGIAAFSVIDFGVTNSAQIQLPATNWVGVWPQPNATNVRYGFTGESPNPVPSSPNACLGYPVSIQTRYDVPLTVTTFTMTDPTGNLVATQLLTTATDPNNALPANTAFIVPLSTLKLNTTYNVSFVGTVNGAAYTQNWSFTTTAMDGTTLYTCSASS